MTVKGAVLQLVRGQEKIFTIALVDDSGNAINLTGQIVTFSLSNQLDGAALITKSTATSGVSVNSPATAGIIQVTLQTADTVALTAGNYFYDIWIDDGLGNQRPATTYSTVQVLSRVSILGPSVPPPTAAVDVTVSLAASSQSECAVLSLTSTQVAWIATMGLDAVSGFQLAPGGATFPGSNYGLEFAFEETGNAGEARVIARNRHPTANRAAHVKIITESSSSGVGTTTIPAGGSVLLNTPAIVPGSGNVVYFGAFGTDNINGVQIAVGDGAIIGADGVAILLESTGNAGEVNLRAYNFNLSTARTVRWFYVIAAATGTATLTSGQSTTLNSSPIVPGTGQVVYVGAFGTNQVNGSQIATAGGSLIPGTTDGVTIVQEETGTAGQVNLRATNLASSSRTIQWGAFFA